MGSSSISDELLGAGQTLCLVDHAASWTLYVNEDDMPAVTRALNEGLTVAPRDLLYSAFDRERRLPVAIGMIRRADGDHLFPSLEEPLQVGDTLLLIGSRSAVGRVEWIASHPQDLRYLLTGYRPADGLLLRWWQQRRQAGGATRS